MHDAFLVEVLDRVHDLSEDHLAFFFLDEALLKDSLGKSDAS